MATTQIWISQDGNVGAGSSWSTGETPAEWNATDEVLVDGVASQVSMTSGLDQSGVSVARIDVADEYHGDLGLPGTPLYFSNAGLTTMRGSGTLYHKSTGGDYIFVDSPNHLNAVSIPDGPIIGLWVKEGHVDMGASASFVQGIGTLATFGLYATVKINGSANTAPHFVHCWDGTMDTGLRGPALADARIEVGGGLLKLHRLTGTNPYEWVTLTGGIIDFDITAAYGSPVILHLVGGTADFRKCRYAFSSLSSQAYIAPGMQILPGPVTTEAVLTASGIRDFRKEYP